MSSLFKYSDHLLLLKSISLYVRLLMYEVFNMICPYELFNHLSACLYYRNVCQDNNFALWYYSSVRLIEQLDQF